MTHDTPQSILALPEDASAPDAYRVLGLTVYESDREKISSAIETTFAKLKAEKGSANAKAWETAVGWVKNAQAILIDASKKAAYDRKLANTGVAAQPPVADPLAGLLPGAMRPQVSPNNPLAKTGFPQTGFGETAKTQVINSLANASPAGFGLPTSATQAASTQQANSDAMQVPRVKRSSGSQSRRGLPWLMIFLSTFCVIAVVSIGGLLYLLTQRGGTPIVINAGGGIYDPNNTTGQVISRPGEVTPRDRKPFDPVMGGLGGDAVGPPVTEDSNSRPAEGPTPAAPTVPADNPGSDSTGDPNNMGPDMAMPAVTDTPMPDPAMPNPIDMPATVPPSPTAPVTETPPTIPPTPEPTPEQLQAGTAAINLLIQAIKQHDWTKMKQLAEAADEAAAGTEQKEVAGMLLQLVDLATFYRGGIEKAIGGLQAGNEFDLNEDLKVVVVEVGPNKLIIRFNGRNKEYNFDSLPLMLAHKLAKLSMPPDSPTTQAAMYAYQAIAPVTTPPYRVQAVESLEKITDEVEGAEPAKLAAAVRFLFQL